jgi:hypothetical protein
MDSSIDGGAYACQEMGLVRLAPGGFSAMAPEAGVYSA